jgi:hypothetical protein
VGSGRVRQDAVPLGIHPLGKGLPREIVSKEM